MKPKPILGWGTGAPASNKLDNTCNEFFVMLSSLIYGMNYI